MPVYFPRRAAPGGPAGNPVAVRSIALARNASLLVLAAALVVVAGWLADMPALTALYLPGPTLKTNAAIALAGLALANLLLMGRRRAMWVPGAVLAAVAVAIGAATLSQHAFGWDLGIDQWVATEAPGALATASPNRMGPPACMALMLLGLSLLLLTRSSSRSRAGGQMLALITCAIALLPVMGFAYGFGELYSLSRLTGIAMVTALALLLLGLAVLAGRPDVGLASVVCREDEVGLFVRRLLFAGVIVPLGLGWVLARLFAAGLIHAQFGIAAMALGVVVVLATMVWRAGAQLAHVSDARARSERALSESERSLRDADRQKTEFLATLSHELRNPLAPIRFALELLSAPPPVAERARQTIARQVQHLTRLIDDLLDLTRISRDKLELHVRPCDLRLLVTDAVDAVTGEVQRARQRLAVDLPAAPVWLLADPDRVVQMLVNLLTNASRHSDPDAAITVGATVSDGEVTLTVRDSGHGIATADLERVFERFVQVGDARHGGLGIGLAIVKALAELHGGRVEAKSAGPGQGAEFSIRLPRAPAPPADAAPAARGPVAPRRILVVDDNRDAADMLCGLLGRAGHVAACAYDGVEALRLARERIPDVGLIDIGMSGMDGYALAARLRSEPALAGIFLVAITGWGQEDDRRRALSSGFDAHLTKPAEPGAIAALLAARFGGEAAKATGSADLAGARGPARSI